MKSLVFASLLFFYVCCFVDMYNAKPISDDCDVNPTECILKQLQQQGLVGGDKKEPNPNEGRNLQKQKESDRRMNSKYAPDCWERKDEIGQEIDPSKPPCIWELYPDEPQEEIKPEED